MEEEGTELSVGTSQIKTPVCVPEYSRGMFHLEEKEETLLLFYLKPFHTSDIRLILGLSR